MKNVYRNLERLTNRIESTSEYDAKIAATGEAFREIYGGIERALNEALQRSTLKGSMWAGVFGGGQAGIHSNAEKFKKYAQAVGFTLDDNLAGLMEIPPGRFRAYENGGNYDMWTLLALSCAQAHGDADHPLMAIARKYPDFLKFIAGLKARRDAVSHGKAILLDDAEQWREIISRTENALRLLLPDIQLGDDKPSFDASDAYDASAAARADLEKIFGFEYICRIKNKGLFMQLQRVRMMLKDSPDPDQCLETATSLASCLQILTEDHLREGSMYSADAEYSSDKLLDKINACGFTFSDTEEFKAFMNTKPGRIKQALRGGAATLGAVVSAFLLLENENTLKEFARLCPEYIQAAARLIVLRGHGSVWESKANADELRELERKVHKIIKIFEEEL